MMVRAAGASRFKKLTHGEQGGIIDRLFINIFPYIVKIFQPIKQLCILHRRMVSRQCLVEMMVGIDKTGTTTCREQSIVLAPAGAVSPPWGDMVFTTPLSISTSAPDSVGFAGSVIKQKMFFNKIACSCIGFPLYSMIHPAGLSTTAPRKCSSICLVESLRYSGIACGEMIPL